MSVKSNNKPIPWQYYHSFHLLICRGEDCSAETISEYRSQTVAEDTAAALPVNRNAVALWPGLRPWIRKRLKRSKNGNLRVWSHPTTLQALNWGLQVRNPVPNSCSKASQEALWLQMGCITFWKVSLALSRAALLPAQLPQVSEASDKAQKAAARRLQEATHPTAPASSYHKFTGVAQSPKG